MIVRLSFAALLLLPVAALAQGNPGPFGGLFGRTPERTGREFTAVEFRNAFGAQYDDAVLLDDSVPADLLPESGYSGATNAGLMFERQRDRLSFKAQGGATYQEFLRTPSFGATTYDAGAQVRAQVTTRINLEGQARYLRSPFFRLVPAYQPAGSAVVIPGDPYVARRLQNDTYDVSAGITSRYSRRSTLSASVSQRETRFDGAPGNTFEVLGAHANWKRELSRSFALRAGYGRERIYQSAFPDAKYIHEIIDVGIDFTKRLSLARRTSLGISTLTSVVQRPITGRRYRVNGGVTLTSHFGRTWHATAGLSRNTEFLPGFLEPLLSDAATGSISGMLSQRSEWLTSVSAGRGRFGFDSPETYLTTQATSRLNWAVTRHVGVYGQYAFYYYRLPSTPTGVVLLNQVSRQAVTVGITTWLPIVNIVRAPRDPQ